MLDFHETHFRRPLVWEDSWLCAWKSGHGDMAVTAVMSLKSAIPVTDTDQGNALVWIRLAG